MIFGEKIKFMDSFNIKEHFEEASSVLSKFIADEQNFEKIAEAGREMVDAIKHGGKIISCGNGGSMCDAMHFAEELTGRYRNDRDPIPAIAISDPSFLTCVGNDYGFDYVFSRFLSGVGVEGDVLLGISTSGNSKNIINAVEVAREMGIKTICLTGKGGGKLGKLADLEIRAPESL